MDNLGWYFYIGGGFCVFILDEVRETHKESLCTLQGVVRTAIGKDEGNKTKGNIIIKCQRHCIVALWHQSVAGSWSSCQREIWCFGALGEESDGVM